MTRSERRLLHRTLILGAAIILAALVLDLAGTFTAPELFFYDIRARYLQSFTPPPTDKLVHIDIDDPSLEAIGRWPWKRRVLAEIIDEMRLAGAKTLSLDIIFPEPEDLETVPIADELAAPVSSRPADGNAAGGEAGGTEVLARQIDNDALLAIALSRFGSVLVPISLNLNYRAPAWPAYRHMVEEIAADPGLEIARLHERLVQKGHKADLAEAAGYMIAARRDAYFTRIEREMEQGPVTLEQLRRRLLPSIDERVVASPELNVLRAEYERYQAISSLRRFARPLDANLPSLLSTPSQQAMLPRLADAAASTGFVDYVPMADGGVRTVPLWVSHHGYVFPQIGLATACLMLDVELADVQITSERVVIPLPDGRRVEIPCGVQKTARGPAAMMNIPWFGGRDWTTMYDFPKHREAAQHLPIRYIHEACVMRRNLERNNRRIDDALIHILQEIDLERAVNLDKAPPPLNDVATRVALVEHTLAKLKRDGTVEFWQSMDPAELKDNEPLLREKIIHAPRQLPELIRQSQNWETELGRRRAILREQLEGKAALVGYTAVATIADVVPTPMHPRTPGVVVHGLVFNSIMTGDFWYTAPRWITALITLGLGGLTLLIVSFFSPLRGFGAATLLGIGYLAFNGIVLFDYGNLLVGAAGPILGSMGVWTGCTLYRYIVETYERARVKKAFGKYVDPAVINYVLETDAELHGQVKEMTVVFTDLAGFTTISEQLKEDTVKLLNEYMGLMVPVIRRHNGVVNKFLGDGIMYFFGAPIDNPDHTTPAIASVLEMQEVMVPFNASLKQRRMPTLSVRAGITSGEMVVGDAGPPDGSDYTVLGDKVNLAARLEPANKVFGTCILINARARELAGDRILVRPIGRIQVVGKTEGVMTYEALALAEKATDHHRQLAAASEAVVTPFLSGRFEESLAAAQRMAEAFGDSKFTALYRDLCAGYLKEPPADGFDGQIVLTGK